MSKPWIHAVSSAQKHGGEPEDYFELHHFFDQTKAFVPSHSHRMFLHSNFGEELAVQLFGLVLRNSGDQDVSVPVLARQHNFEDLGRTPDVCEYLDGITAQPWMYEEARIPDRIKQQIEDYERRKPN